MARESTLVVARSRYTTHHSRNWIICVTVCSIHRHPELPKLSNMVLKVEDKDYFCLFFQVQLWNVWKLVEHRSSEYVPAPASSRGRVENI
jgi:hypothetical protein